MVRICKNCKKDHNGNYGSGTFCSKHCARGFSTKEKRLEINAKVSAKLKEKYPTLSLKDAVKKRRKHSENTKSKISQQLKISSANFVERKNKEIITLSAEEVYNKYGKNSLLKKILFEQNNSCNICKVITWNDKNLVLELDHIDGNSYNNQRDNLRYLCPNCHSQTKNFRGRNIKKENHSNGLIIPESEFLILINAGLNNRQILIKLNLSPAGGNYARVEAIRKKFYTPGGI